MLTYFKQPLITFNILITIILSINIIKLHNTYLGIIFGILFFLLTSYTFTKIFPKSINKNIKNFISFILLINSIIILTSIFYYIQKLDNKFITSTLIILTFINIIINRKKNFKTLKFNLRNLNIKFNKSDLIISILYLTSIILIYLITKTILNIKIYESVRSFWKFIPNYFFYLYILNTFIIIILSLYSRWIKLNLLFIIIHIFVTISLVIFLFPLGFGFDPFIHKATEKIIYEQGQITPKPFYYIGMYSFIVFLSKIFFISINYLHDFLVPILFSIVLPLSIFFFCTKFLQTNKNLACFISLLSLTIPLSLFIITTPQSFANILALNFIFLFPLYKTYFIKNKKLSLFLSSLHLISIILIHPIAGISTFIFFVIYLLSQNNNIIKIHKKLKIIIYLFLIILLPIAFLLNNFIQTHQISIITNLKIITKNFHPIFAPYTFYFVNQYNLIKDLIYFFINNYFYIITFTSISIIILLNKQKKYQIFNLYFKTFIILLLNYFILKTFVPFNNLINYEKLNFAFRVLFISQYFLLPLFLYAVIIIFKPFFKKQIFSYTLFIIVLTILAITSSFYTAYPREDGYVYSSGYNLSTSDLKAINFVHNDAQKNQIKNYIVLANQIVSAGALYKYGFYKYYTTKQGQKIFYYPIPTSSPLYNIYLESLNNLPSSNLIQKASKIAQVKTVYLIINKYWANSSNIISFAKTQTNFWKNFDNGKVYVFKFIF